LVKGYRRLKKYFLIGAGFLALVLGTVGIVVPVLPTTPFVLLAATCFASVSPRLHTWLVNNKYFGEFIANYQTQAGVRKSVKIKTLAVLYCTLCLSFFLVRLWYVGLILLAVAVFVTIHILRMKTKE